jgi:hypothetical protein
MESDGVHRSLSTFHAILSPSAISGQTKANSADISKAKLLKPDRKFESLSDRQSFGAQLVVRFLQQLAYLEANAVAFSRSILLCSGACACQF